MNHRNTNITHFGSGRMLIASTQATILRKPGIGSFDDPADGKLHETLVVLVAADDMNATAGLPLSDELREASLLIGAIAIDGVQFWIVVRVQLLQTRLAAHAIGHVAGGNNNGQQQTDRKS